MLPLALLVALLVAIGFPSIHQHLATSELAGAAQVWSKTLAARLARTAESRPLLWPYDTARLLETVSPAVSRPIRAGIRIDVPRVDRVFEAGPLEQQEFVAAWSPIQINGKTVGRIQVRLDGTGLAEDSQRVWLGSILLGLILGTLLFALPVKVIGQAERDHANLWEALTYANESLEARVEQRTAQLRQRESQLQDLGARLVSVQEEERARISRDLHDDLGQTLTGLRLRLTAVQATLAPDSKAVAHLATAQTVIDDGVEQVRGLAHRLRPPALDALGLCDALGGLVDEWIVVAELDYQTELEPINPPPVLAVVLFRVVQEALTNVARHAQAKCVTVACGAREDGFFVRVEDDGVGMVAPGQLGLGLAGLRERVSGVGGILSLTSGQEESGLILDAWVPNSDTEERPS